MRKGFFLLIIGLCSLMDAVAQQKMLHLLKRVNVQTINFEQGLLDNSVKDIVTDTFGFTWISTRLGIQRYNGNMLESITPVVKKDTIRINSFSFFFKLKSGMLWISYQNGILEYNPFTGAYRYIIFDSLYHKQSLFFPVKESEHGVWFLQGNDIIVDVNKKDGTIQKKISFQINSKTNTGYDYEPLMTHNKDFVFIREKENDVTAINLNTGAVKTIEFPEDIQSMAFRNGRLYAVSLSSLMSFNILKDKIDNVVNLKPFFSDKIFSARIKFTGKNQLLLCVNNRLSEFDTSCIFKNEYTALNNGPVVSTGYIDKIYADRFNRLWLITNDDIKKIQNTEIPFQNFSYTNAKNNFVRCIYYDKEKKILLAGCYNGGIQLYDTLGNALWTEPLMTEKVKDILSIEKLSADEYLITTYNDGWFTLSLSSKKLIPFLFTSFSSTVSFPGNLVFINNLQRLNDSIIFIATPPNVFRCVVKNGILKNTQPCFHSNDSLKSGINNCLITNDETIWAGTNDGVLYREHNGRQLAPISLPYNFPIRCLAEDNKKNVWVGTEKGLYEFSPEGKFIKKISAETGLRNDCIYSLLCDKNNTMYAGTNLGLSQIMDDGTIKNYTKQNGLQDNEFNTESAAKSLSGRFFFGGVNGITAFYPETLNAADEKPSLLIYKVDINSDEYKSDSAIWAVGKLNLNYSQNKIAFSVSAEGMQNAGDYQYEYKMEGYDKYWSVTNTPVDIHYDLSAGNYRFIVRLAGSSTEKSLIISIAVPFWKKWWFYTLSLLLLLAMFFLIIRFFYRRKYYGKLRALEMQQQLYHERERISRDLHDNLGAYTSAITTQVDDIAQQYKSYNNPSVKQLKNSAREIMSQLRDTIWALNQENISITMLSDRIKNFFHKISPGYAAVQFDVEEKIEQEKYLSSVNGLHIFRIIQEAIHNAIKHSGCTVIKVVIFSGKTISLSIEDNGKGLDNNIISQGNGLVNMKERAKEINWELILQNKEESGFCITLKGNS
jgi:two-component sensor histidine kinase